MLRVLYCVFFVLFWNNISLLAIADERELVISFLKKSFEDCKIKDLESEKGFQFVLEVRVRQYLDHNNKKGGFFYQKFILHHRAKANPNVMVTEGYKANGRVYEATKILNANQVDIEYRFFDESRPEVIDWSLMTQEQGLEDFYFIQKKLKKLYSKKWCATGISKGGTTCVLYKMKYPRMLDAVVSYVGPFANAQEDKRTIEHYTSKVGTAACRKKIKDFQIHILQNRAALIPKLDSLAVEENTSFPIGVNRVIDYAAAEYPFSFWQWGFSCDEVPSYNSSVDEIFAHVEEVVDFNFYDEKQCSELLPAYYQFMTEYGYYGFDTTGIGNLLSDKNLTNLTFCPKNTDLSFKHEFMQKMTKKAERKSKETILIYGANDTWTACALNLHPKAKALKFVKANSGHRTRIKDLSQDEKNQIYASLKKWMKTDVTRL